MSLNYARQALLDGAVAFAAGDRSDRERQRALCEAAKAYTRAFDEAAANPPGAPERPASAGAVFPNYGGAKGQPVEGASVRDLEYYANGARRCLADESKARFHAKERALLAAIEAELARRGES